MGRTTALVCLCVASACCACATSSELTSSSTTDAVVDVPDASAPDTSVADARDGYVPPACACCGTTPFAARLADDTNTIVATAAGDMLTAGNVYTDGKLGPLWLSQIGEGGATMWKRVFDGEVGLLTELIETESGGFTLLRTGGTGNVGARLISTRADGTLRWAKTLAPEKADLVANGVAATSKGYVVVGAHMGAWIGRYDADGNLIGETNDTALGGWRTVNAYPGGNLAMCGGTSSTVCAVETASGAPVWRRTLSIAWMPMQLVVARDGGLYVAGVEQVLDPPPTGSVLPGRTKLAKFDATGELVWQKDHQWSKPAEFSVQALVATPDGGFALHGYMRDAAGSGGMRYWYALRGDPAGALTWAKGYAPEGPPGGQGTAVAGCREGVLLLGASQTAAGGGSSWMIRTNAKGEVPLTPPGSTIDL